VTLVNVQSWIQQAQRECFAVGAFNANTLEQLQAIVMAAQAEQAPVIVQISHHALQYLGNGNAMLGMRYISEMGRIAAESVTAPVALHLDHGTKQEVLQAIASGFTSVMFDGDDMTLEENIRTTIELRDLAHSMGVSIEAEIGAVARADGSEKVDHETELTQPSDAAAFARDTGIDALAIAIGSVHAIRYKHVALDLPRLKAIRSMVDVPLVLHGSSGVLDADITESIRLGICKVNTATQLTQAFTGAIRARLAEDSAEPDPRKYLGPAREAMKERVRERMRFLGAAGKAAPFMAGASR
jgi:fructose-bisphosphate aldolase class II